MINKGFKWILDVLAENSSNLEILETYVIKNFSATDYFYTEDSQVKNKKNINNLTAKEVLETIGVQQRDNSTNVNTMLIFVAFPYYQCILPTFSQNVPCFYIKISHTVKR